MNEAQFRGAVVSILRAELEPERVEFVRALLFDEIDEWMDQENHASWGLGFAEGVEEATTKQDLEERYDRGHAEGWNEGHKAGYTEGFRDGTNEQNLAAELAADAIADEHDQESTT